MHSVAAAAFAAVLSLLIETLPQLAESSQLVRRQDPADRKFVLYTDTANFRLCGLHVLKHGLNLGLIDEICIYRSIE